jgi:site-specific DNA-cytosine methylase
MRKVDDPRNALYEEFVRVVKEAKPAMFVGENVPGLVSMLKGDIIKKICEEFAMVGYDVTWKIINCADYGVPQIRKRVIILGSRVDQMTLREDGSTSYIFCAAKGEIRHPEEFYKRLKRWKKETKGMKFTGSKEFLKKLNKTEKKRKE